MSTEERQKLAGEQAALIRALVAGGELPPGFDERKAGATSRSLARKRGRLAARAWPALSAALGEEAFVNSFEQYALGRPLPAEGGTLVDGWGFGHWLERGGDLPRAARLELMLADSRVAGPVGLRAGRDGRAEARLRRGPYLRAGVLREPHRLVLVVRPPNRRARWVAVRVTRR